MSYFENAKVGDKVCAFEIGEDCEITSITDNALYPIGIKNKSGHGNDYTLAGRLYSSCHTQTAFYGSKLPTFDIPPPPMPKPPMDTPVMVWNVGSDQFPRYVKDFKDGKIRCFNNGQTSFSTAQGYATVWYHWELYTEDES